MWVVNAFFGRIAIIKEVGGLNTGNIWSDRGEGDRGLFALRLQADAGRTLYVGRSIRRQTIKVILTLRFCYMD